ncbi:TetR/AcrR family transcriptional regulator [Pseudomonas sp. 3A(2025)]
MKIRTAARRAAIVETAASVFLELGYEGTSMNEVSKRLGGSKATLYGYFPSKEELFVAVVEMYATAHLNDAVSGLVATATEHVSLKEQLLQFGRRMLMIILNDSTAIRVYRMVLAESGRSEIGVLFHQSGPSQCIDALSAHITRAMQNGELHNANPRVRAKQFLSLLTAEPDERLFQQAPQPVTLAQIEEMVTNAVDLFLGGAAPR